MVEISIVIPSIGRSGPLLDTLSDLSAQSIINWEAIIILQGGRNNEIVERAYKVTNVRGRVVLQEEPNANKARNRGLIEARAPIVLFLDDDVRIIHREFLRRHLGPYSDSKRCGVFGQVRGRDNETRSNRHAWSRNELFGWLYFPTNFDQALEVRAGASNNLSVRRENALAIGGFDERFKRGAHREETDFCLRLTDRYGPFLFSPAAWLIHLGEASGGGAEPGERARGSCQCTMHSGSGISSSNGQECHTLPLWRFCITWSRHCAASWETWAYVVAHG